MQLGFCPDTKKWVLFTFELREGLVIVDSDEDEFALMKRNGMPDASDDDAESDYQVRS
jgi:hypothetical protein